MLAAWQQAQQRFPLAAQRRSVRIELGDLVLEDWIDQLRSGPDPADPALAVTAWLELDAAWL